MARIASFTSAGVPTGPDTGLTLDALMARQKLLADQASKISADREMKSPWQGAAYVGEMFANSLNQRRADTQLGQSRDALSAAMSGIDLAEGATPEQIAEVARFDPDQAQQLMRITAEAVRARRLREQTLADRADDRAYDATVKAGDRAYTEGNEGRIDIREAGQEAAINERERLEAEATAKAEEARKIEEEKRKAEAAAAIPSTPEGKILSDFNSGKYGDPATPEAQQLKDEALKSARGGNRATAQDRKALWGQQDEYVNSVSAVGNLQRAAQLLAEGIDTGPMSGVRTWAGNAEVPGAGLVGADKELATRTKEYNDLMTTEAISAMSQALKGATTDTEMAQFIKVMNDPLAPPLVKQQHLDRMLAKANSFLELQRQRITELGGDLPQVATPAAPQANEKLLDEARKAIANGAPADLVKKRLMEKGVDPGAL